MTDKRVPPDTDDMDAECLQATLDTICREAEKHGKSFCCATCGGSQTLDGERSCPSCDGHGWEHDPGEVIAKQAARIAELERRIERARADVGTLLAKIEADGGVTIEAGSGRAVLLGRIAAILRGDPDA